MSLAKIRVVLWGEVAFWVGFFIGVISGLITIIEKVYHFREAFQRLAVRLAVVLVKPKPLGVAILIPSMYFGFPIWNQIMARPEIVLTGGPVFMQNFLLIISGLMIGAELLGAPSPRHRCL